MELRDALRTTGAVRDFRDEPVPDDVVARVLDTARFAPSGGNRQSWRVVVVRDAGLRARIKECYLRSWYPYRAMGAAGLTPWAPITDRALEAEAIARADELAVEAAAGPGGFAEHLDEVPVMLVLLADLRLLAAVDRDLDRYTFVGAASVYPFAWSLLLAARDEGLGGVMTTMAVQSEDELRELLEVPEEFAVAAVLALGYPVHQVTKLRRDPVAEFATYDRFEGEPVQVES